MKVFADGEITRKRKAMGLSQRKTALMLQKLYGVKISHSYLSIIERGRVDSISAELQRALEDFFKISRGENSTVHRIPLYKGKKVSGHLDLPGPVLADFAVEADYDLPAMGIFRGDVIVCRKGRPSFEHPEIIPQKQGFTYNYSGEKHPDSIGTAVLIIKKSVEKKYHDLTVKAAATILAGEDLIKLLAERAGVREIDLFRSLAVLRGFSKE